MVGGGGGTVKRREYGAITIEYCEREVEGFCWKEGVTVIIVWVGSTFHTMTNTIITEHTT